jgi:hypothetical protein
MLVSTSVGHSVDRPEPAVDAALRATHVAGGRLAWIAIVGVCGSGKSELERRLRTRGLDARAVAQEHSHVSELWRHDGEPLAVVYLGASCRTVRRRPRKSRRLLSTGCIVCSPAEP